MTQGLLPAAESAAAVRIPSDPPAAFCESPGLFVPTSPSLEPPLLLGPVFTREAVTTPRRPRLYFYRSIYVAALLVLIGTAWLLMAGTQQIQSPGDMARFGGSLFQVLAPLQLAVMTFLSAILAAGSVAQEKDKNTLILLLMTRMSNVELVLGKLTSSLLIVVVMLAAALPVFMMMMLFGGISLGQIAWVFAVTLVTLLAAGSLGCLIAFWREKTFQILSMTILTLVFWLGIWEVAALFGDRAIPLIGISWQTLATAMSPLRAIVAAADPVLAADPELGPLASGVNLFLVAGALATVLLNAVAIWRVRIWNPTREVRHGQQQAREASIWGAEHDLAAEKRDRTAETAASGAGTEQQAALTRRAEEARSGHIDARVAKSGGRHRQVWDNPVLWREVRTRAYGRKMLIIRLAYLALFVMAVGGVYWALTSNAAMGAGGLAAAVPAAAKPLAPFLLVSVVIVNALAVTSVTSERDGRALDLLLVTDLSPREFLLGKLGGVFWVTKEMIVLPAALCVYLWINTLEGGTRGLTLETLIYVLISLGVMYFFAAMLGIHCGTSYANSRTAIAISLGTVFFLFLGVMTVMLMLISFTGEFQLQLGPFLALMVGGSVGLYAALGIRNPSLAILLGAVGLPFATFYAITSFLIGESMYGYACLVVVLVYGFTAAALLVPALFEFNIDMGRARTARE